MFMYTIKFPEFKYIVDINSLSNMLFPSIFYVSICSVFRVLKPFLDCLVFFTFYSHLYVFKVLTTMIIGLV